MRPHREPHGPRLASLPPTTLSFLNHRYLKRGWAATLTIINSLARSATALPSQSMPRMVGLVGFLQQTTTPLERALSTHRTISAAPHIGVLPGSEEMRIAAGLMVV